MPRKLQYDHYSMIIEWDPDDSIFVVTVPELPGCRTHGETYEDAVKHGQQAIESWIDAARVWGNPIPKPRVFAPT
jgi:predicted RNase H-like HicB family nuclease